jgi:hypothetical protein
VFLDNAVSGATLGYYGTLLEHSIHRSGLNRVHLPALGQVVTVAERDILLLGEDQSYDREMDAGWALANQKWEIEFESPLEQDNQELWGTYRIGSSLVGKFYFSKRDQPQPTYQFAIPAQGNSGVGKLQYFTSSAEALNRDVVMLALSEILGVKIPAGGNNESPATGGD